MMSATHDAVYANITLIEQRLRREFAHPRQHGAA
jgi:hypothetical protein